MTPAEWAGTAALDVLSSVAGIVLALHFDLAGRWEDRQVRRAGEREEALIAARQRADRRA